MAIRTKSEKRFGAFANTILVLAALLCVVPFIMLILGSFTDNNSIIKDGYALIPMHYSLDAYRYLTYQSGLLTNAYAITVLTTAVGTAASLLLTSSLSYGLTRKHVPGIRVISFIILFTMLFHGGLVPSYMVYTQLVNVKNTLWAYILPGMLLNGFYVMLMRSYFKNNIHSSLIESAEIDGAKELSIFFKIVLPLSLPMLATIGLLVGVNYWNSWQNGLYYITKQDKYSIMNILNRMLQDIRYLQTGAMGDYGSELMANLPSNSVRMAIAVVGVLPILLLYPFFQRYFIKGISMGAVKG